MVSIFIGAVVFSVWSVMLFFDKSIGLSMLLFTVPFTCFLINLLEKKGKVKNKKAKIILIPVTLLASTYCIFNNSFFGAINIFVIPILLSIMLLELFGRKFKFNIELIAEIIIGIVIIPISYISETFEKLVNILKEKLNIKRNKESHKKIGKIIKGILITIPIALIIIMLLASADEIFENIFSEMFRIIFNIIRGIKFDAVMAKVILTIIIFIYLSSFFYYICEKYKREEEEEEEEEGYVQKDNFTIKMILGVLNTIYLIFCIIQINSLFMRNTDINYADYARQGFFQLMAVSAVNLVMILVAKRKGKDDKYISITSIVMIIFTFIILISAALRMYLYETAYGYTLLRLLVYCSLFTEAVLLIPTILYILNKKINLSKTYFIVILTVYVCMNFLNFDYIIAKRNIDRYLNTENIDVSYLRHNTGTDAVKQLIRFIESTKEMTKEKVEAGQYLKNVYKELEARMDFRDFNISKIRAKELIEKSEVLNTDYFYKPQEAKKTAPKLDSNYIINNENIYIEGLEAKA